jgi:hypothetical protein
MIFHFALEFSAAEEDRNFSPILSVPFNLQLKVGWTACVVHGGDLL